jgi:hypothetical protein
MQTLLNELFRYEDGQLYWRELIKFCHQDITKPVGSSNDRGYVEIQTVRIPQKRDYLHRLIWMLHNGTIAKGLMVDHIDRDTANSRIENLRLVTSSENACNKDVKARVRPARNVYVKTLKDGSTRYGVLMWRKGQHHGKGGFEVLEEAVEYAKTLRETLHKEFACHS